MHPAHEDEPSDACAKPAGHFEHSVAPFAEVSHPAGQFEHLLFPLPVPYIPVSQLLQPPTEVCPMAVLYLPFSHSSQTVSPMSLLYLPASQFWHTARLTSGFS